MWFLKICQFGLCSWIQGFCTRGQLGAGTVTSREITTHVLSSGAGWVLWSLCDASGCSDRGEGVFSTSVPPPPEHPDRPAMLLLKDGAVPDCWVWFLPTHWTCKPYTPYPHPRLPISGCSQNRPQRFRDLGWVNHRPGNGSHAQELSLSLLRTAAGKPEPCSQQSDSFAQPWNWWVFFFVYFKPPYHPPLCHTLQLKVLQCELPLRWSQPSLFSVNQSASHGTDHD